MSDADDHGFELVMPFVLCQTQGGPYDDAAFASGWRLGSLDARLEFERPDGHSMYVEPPDVKQLDLVAMRHRYSVEVEEHLPIDDWVRVTLKKLP